MKFNFKAAAAGIATVAIAGGGLLVSAGAASAAPTAPPYEPDANAAAPYGNVLFFDANGNQVTSGTNDLSNPFAYVVGTTAADGGAIKANLAFTKPVSGTNPSLWTSVAEAGPTTFSPATSLPAGTPANIAAYAPTFPVVATPQANISTWIPGNPTDTNAGYVDTIQVRLTDSKQAAGTYWESDIVYNNTASPVTLDGVSVPANGWAEVFPSVNSTTTSLTTSASGGTLTGGTALNLSATVAGASAGDTGTVAFLDGSTVVGKAPLSGGTATFSYTPGPGSHSYQAAYLGDESNAGTASATQNGASTSAAQPVTVSAVPTATQVSVQATPIVSGDSDTFTANITEGDSGAAGLAGSVQFFDIAPGATAASPLGSPVSTTVSGTTASASVTSSSLTTVGTYQVYATFTPTNSGYQSSTSPQTAVQVTNKVATTTGLTANPTASSPGAPVTLTASVTDANSNAAGVAGSVQFFDTPTGGSQTSLGSPVATVVSGTTGTATLVYSSLPQTTGSNADNVTAVFTPTSADYVGSTSPAVAVTVVPQGACSYSGSNCTDQQNVQVTVTNGSITITTPYTASNPFTLPNMQLSSDGTYLYTCATFPATGVTATTPVSPSSCNDTTGHNTAPGTAPGNTAPGTPPLGIVVTSTLNQNPDWTASVTASDLTGQVTGKTISSSGLGLTDGATAYQSANPTQQKLAYTNTGAKNPSPYYSPSLQGSGLGSTPVTFASTTGGGDGTTVMFGQLTLFAPTSAPADLYQGTLTFTVTPGTNSNPA